MMHSGGDLVTLSEELRAFDLENGLELALALRKAKRPRRQAASLKGWRTRRGRSGAVAPSGCEASPSAPPLRSGSSLSRIPNAGSGHA